MSPLFSPLFNLGVPGASYNNNPNPGQNSALQLVQNETITNGGAGMQNAFTYAANMGAAQNWQTNGGAAPVLDMFGGQAPAPPFYSTQPAASAGSTVSLTGFDSPAATLNQLAGKGLRVLDGQIVSSLGFTFNFELYLTWQMPAGAGPRGGPAPTE